MQSPDFKKRWYIWYTKPKAEKKVQTRLQKEGVEVFLPERKELRQWSDRKKWVYTLLFPGYIFTLVNKKGFIYVRYLEGISYPLIFEGEPAFLSQDEVDRINKLLIEPDKLKVAHRNFYQGEEVEIIAGPFMGVRGLVVNYQGSKRLAVNIEQLGKALLVQVPINKVRKTVFV